MEVLIFFLKALIVVLSIVSIIIAIAMVATKVKEKNELEVEPLHKKFQELGFFLKSFTLTKEDLKEEKKRRKEEEKKEKESSPKKRVYLLNFEGDLHAAATESLREEITALLQTATPQDEVVVKVESPGGVVHGYGLASSQLLRIRDRGIPLTVCVDKVAASGGYMMACVANKVISAPFAIVGSIGVVAQLPNFHKLLQKHDVDFKEYTAGEYKRTVGVLTEITPEKEAHFQSRLHDTHRLFKDFVRRFRPHMDLHKVATGDYWFGEEAKSLGLVDELMTSDDYLLSFGKDTPIFELKYIVKETLSQKIAKIAGQTSIKIMDRWVEHLSKKNLL